MLLVIPVSEADAHLVEPVSTLIVKFGGCALHDLLVVGSNENAVLVQDVAERLRPCFKSTRTHTFVCNAKGWPKGPNAYFRSTVSYLFADGMMDQPWYFFELDNTPLKAGWLDALQTEYNLKNAVFMGAKHPTYYTDQDRKLVINGHHMAGTGIYPTDFVNRSSLWRYEEGVAFDVWIQWEVLPLLTDTQLIQHNWQTGDYRMEEGQVVCDSLNVPHPDLKFNHPLRSDAVVLHGCKDGSLAQLVLNGFKQTRQEPPVEILKPLVVTEPSPAKTFDRRRRTFRKKFEVAA